MYMIVEEHLRSWQVSLIGMRRVFTIIMIPILIRRITGVATGINGLEIIQQNALAAITATNNWYVYVATDKMGLGGFKR
jgi:hypothetical protein